MATVLRAVHRRFNWRSILALCVLSGVLTAFYGVNDNYLSHTHFKSVDNVVIDITTASAYLIVGGWVGVLGNFVYALLLGKRFIDPKFEQLTWRKPRMQALALLGGGVSAVATWLQLFTAQKQDPSVIAALGSLTLVFMLVYDVLKKQVDFRKFAPWGVAAVLGSAAVSYVGKLTAETLQAFVLVGVLACILSAINRVAKQEGTRSSDSVNFHVWRFLWLALLGTVFAVAVAMFNQTTGLLLEMVVQAIKTGWVMGLVVLTMLFVFFASSLENVAMGPKKVGGSYVFVTTTATQLIITMVLTYLVDLAAKGVVGEVPTDPAVWGVRVVGIFVVIWSLFQLKKMEPEPTED